MTNEELIKISQEVLAQTYGRLPVVLVRGQGCRVWDAEGKEYLDFVAGIGVCNLGHCHPKVVQAIREQAGKLLHVSNLYHIEPQVQLAQLLVKHSFADRVFFCNSGTEANEAAIKLARKYSQDHFGPGRFEIISLLKSFHGRTLGALAATGQERFHKGFEPMLPGFKFVPQGDLAAMEAAISPATCAVMVEPIQAEGGVNLPDGGYLRALRRLCEQKKLLLIYDEIQVGMGRTGKLFAYEHYGVPPDIMTMAKGLASGFPLSCVASSRPLMEKWMMGTHGGTYGGNPVACAAAVATIRVMKEGLIENSAKMGSFIMEKMRALQKKYPIIGDVRGLGLMIGTEFTKPDGSPAPEIVKSIISNCREEKLLLLNCGTYHNVIRWIPPLVVNKEQAEEALAIFEKSLQANA